MPKHRNLLILRQRNPVNRQNNDKVILFRKDFGDKIFRSLFNLAQTTKSKQIASKVSNYEEIFVSYLFISIFV